MMSVNTLVDGWCVCVCINIYIYIYISEGVPSRAIGSLGAMGEGPGNLRFVASLSRRCRGSPQKVDIGTLGQK